VNKDYFLVNSVFLPNLAVSLDWLGRAALSNRAAPMMVILLIKTVLPTASP